MLGPFGLMRRLFDDIEQLVGVGERLEPSERAATSLFVPQVDVSQQKDKVLVQVDLPGMAPSDVSLRIEDGALIIEGERKSEREIEAGGVVRAERYYGRFQRVVPLPEGADPDSAEARFENGVLEISVKTPPREKARQIEIKTGAPESDTTKH
jgi:HSP20 family protein